MRKINQIIIHCSDTFEGKHWTVDDIRSWHIKRGWLDIGYHYVIYLDGSIHRGRNEDVVGSHCLGYNSHSIGICYVGGKEKGTGKTKDTRTPAQKESLIRLLIELVCRYPDAEILGHRDLAPDRKCPGFDAKEEYKTL